MRRIRGDTPGSGHPSRPKLSGSVVIPSTLTSSSAAVTMYEPNDWGTSFPGNNTNPAFPSSDLTATGNVPITDVGYWEVASDGDLFSLGAAQFHGSMRGMTLNKPVVGMWSTKKGDGYWEAPSRRDLRLRCSALPRVDGRHDAQQARCWWGPRSGASHFLVVPHQNDDVERVRRGEPDHPLQLPGDQHRGDDAHTRRGHRHKNSVSCPSGTLAKGASETCTRTYKVSQTDVDSGSVTNSATVSGTTPFGTIVSSSPSVVTVLANSTSSSLTMTKSSTTSSFAAAGDLIHYQ